MNPTVGVQGKSVPDIQRPRESEAARDSARHERRRASGEIRGMLHFLMRLLRNSKSAPAMLSPALIAFFTSARRTFRFYLVTLPINSPIAANEVPRGAWHPNTTPRQHGLDAARCRCDIRAGACRTSILIAARALPARELPPARSWHQISRRRCFVQNVSGGSVARCKPQLPP